MSRAPRGLSEHEWIRRLLARLGPASPPVAVGPGDDAAALRVGGTTLVVTTDALVEGVHFRPGWFAPRALGARAYGVNASDVAAMGGRPLAALVALGVPPRTPTGVLDGIMAGFVAAGRRHRTALIGGNLSRARDLSITVTMLGRCPGRPVTRAGARVGDRIFVTGTLGGYGYAVRRRQQGRRAALPSVPDRVAGGATLARWASAMIDVSDGLLQDLGHVARASGVGMEIDADRIPVAPACRVLGTRAVSFAATAGEDYELAFTMPSRHLGRLARLGLPVTEIGRVVRGERVRLLGPGGLPIAVRGSGFDHRRVPRLAGGRRRG